jgi:hypothetical protein
LKRKQRDDPLNLIRELTGEKEKHKKHKKSKAKEKERERESKNENSSSTHSTQPAKKTKTIEELRAER